MNYTNGFDIDKVLPALQQRLGWRQPTTTGSPVLTDANKMSKSGRLFNDNSFHAICTIANIKANQEDPNINDGDFNTYITNLQNGLIVRSLNEVFRKPELLEQQLLYTRYGWSDVLIGNSGQWCGWMIDTGNDPGISTQISFAMLYFDSNVMFNLYLFQDGIREPLKTVSVSATAFSRTKIELDQMVLPFETGGKYYLMYNQTELGSAKAIREQVETFCQSLCFSATPIQAAATTDGSYFNHNNKQYTGLPAGVNLEVISFRDHTQSILRKANLFDEVQGLQMAAVVVELANNSIATNAIQRQSQQQSAQLYTDLNQSFATNEVPMTPGLKSRIFSEFKRLRETFFPRECAVSMDMQSDCGGGLDSYERQWGRINAQVRANPGVLVTTG